MKKEKNQKKKWKNKKLMRCRGGEVKKGIWRHKRKYNALNQVKEIFFSFFFLHRKAAISPSLCSDIIFMLSSILLAYETLCVQQFLQQRKIFSLCIFSLWLNEAMRLWKQKGKKLLKIPEEFFFHKKNFLCVPLTISLPINLQYFPTRREKK